MSTATTDWRGDVLDVVYSIASRRIALATILAASVAFGFAAASVAEPYYRASSTIVLLPREKPILDLSVQSASVETSEDAAKRSPSATLALPPNPDLYTTLMTSADVTQRVSAKLAGDPLFSGRPIPAAADIRGALGIGSTEEGVIKIAMTHADPRVAAAVVNALVHECTQASKAIERQLILQQSGFLGVAIERAEQRLSDAREKLSRFSAEFGLADPATASARSAMIIRTLDETEARLSRELEALATHRTSADPLVRTLSSELAEVRSRRASVQDRYCGQLSESQFAAIESEWRALEQDVTLRQDLLMSMRARHDVFSIRADQPAGNIAVVRPAESPLNPAGPSRKRFLVLSVLLGGLVSCVYCVFADQIARVRRDPAMSKRLTEIRASLWPFGAMRAGEASS